MRTAAVALVGALVLAGCSDHPGRPTASTDPSRAGAPSATSAGTAAGTPTGVPVVVPTTGTPPSGPSQPGAGAPVASRTCTGGVAAPRSAVTRPIPDVDGDRRGDTGLIYAKPDGTPVIGVHTAAGGTFVADFSSASGAQGRAVTFAAVAPGGPFVALTDDGRQSQLFVVKGCRLVAARDRRGEPYQFDLRDFGGSGDGVTCGSVAGGPRTLVGFLYRRDAAGTTTGGETRTEVLLGGLTGSGAVTAANGTSQTVAAMTSPDGISCGAVTQARDAIRLPS